MRQWLPIAVLIFFHTLGTTLAVVLSSLILYIHFTDATLTSDLSADTGAIAILGYSLPFVFFTSLFTSLERNQSSSCMVQELKDWLLRLALSVSISMVLVGSLVVVLMVWAIASQKMIFLLIGIVFPALCLWISCHPRFRKPLG